MQEDVAAARYRSIFISDIHLGTRGCKAEFLLDFLRETEAETIYLVGDIVDGWRLKKSWFWPQATWAWCTAPGAMSEPHTKRSKISCLACWMAWLTMKGLVG
jgi:UDP-2,3-diacylglucosamine pyrophosphatase LpxH